MRTNRILAVATGAVLMTLVAATAAQGAYVASVTIIGSNVKTLSVLECRALVATSQALDTTSTTEVEGYPCSSVTARAFYTTTDGHALWTNTVSGASQAKVKVTGTKELQKSYSTATR